MLFAESSPPDERAQLARLHLSLNNPVVATDALPAGPASAAIALHRAAGGSAHLSVAFRSAKTGQLVFYSPREAVDAAEGAADAIEAAVCFAESLGFLFDEDEVQGRGEPRVDAAARLWAEFVARPTGDTVRAEAATAGPEPALAESGQRVEPAPSLPPEPSDVAFSPQPRERLLSKFRMRSAQNGTAARGGPAALPTRP